MMRIVRLIFYILILLLGLSFAVLNAPQLSIKGIERGNARACRREAFVGQVVGGAREAIDRNDRRPQPRRHEP